MQLIAVNVHPNLHDFSANSHLPQFKNKTQHESTTAQNLKNKSSWRSIESFRSVSESGWVWSEEYSGVPVTPPNSDVTVYWHTLGYTSASLQEDEKLIL